MTEKPKNSIAKWGLILSLITLFINMMLFSVPLFTFSHLDLHESFIPNFIKNFLFTIFVLIFGATVTFIMSVLSVVFSSIGFLRAKKTGVEKKVAVSGLVFAFVGVLFVVFWLITVGNALLSVSSS